MCLIVCLYEFTCMLVPWKVCVFRRSNRVSTMAGPVLKTCLISHDNFGSFHLHLPPWVTLRVKAFSKKSPAISFHSFDQHTVPFEQPSGPYDRHLCFQQSLLSTFTTLIKTCVTSSNANGLAVMLHRTSFLVQ